MFPQGSGILNLAYFSSITDRVNNCRHQSELTALQTELNATLAAQAAGITATLAVITPMLALLTPPTSPTAVITWAANLITDFLTPMLKPAVSYATQATALTAQQATLTAAIATKMASLPP